MTVVSLVDEEREWFNSHHGIDTTETTKNLILCSNAINTPISFLLVNDTKKDERFLTIH